MEIVDAMIKKIIIEKQIENTIKASIISSLFHFVQVIVSHNCGMYIPLSDDKHRKV